MKKAILKLIDQINSLKECEDCGEILSKADKEKRDYGYELITYCKCGTTYSEAK